MLKLRSISKKKRKRSSAKKNDRRETRRFASNVSLGIVLTGALVALVVLANKWMAKEQLQTVRVVGEVVLDTAEVLKQAALTDSARIQELNLKEIEGRVAEHPFIRNAAAYYGGDGELVLEIHERSPVVAAVVNGYPVYLDENGFPLPFRFGLAAPDVPVLAGIHAEKEGVLDSLKVIEAIGVAEVLRQHSEAVYRRFASIRREASGEYTLMLADGAVPVLAGLPGEIGPRLSKLEAFLRNVLSVEGASNAELIDLRWNGQVVVRWHDRETRV